MSKHLMLEISVPQLCATQTARWLEWVDWAAASLEGPPQYSDRQAVPVTAPGLGLRWDEQRIGKLEAL